LSRSPLTVQTERGLKNLSSIEKKEQPLSVWTVRGEQTLFALFIVKDLILDIVLFFLRKKLKGEITFLPNGILPKTESDFIIYFHIILIILAIHSCKQLKKYKWK